MGWAYASWATSTQNSGVLLAPATPWVQMPEGFKYPSPMLVFTGVMLSYFIVTAGIAYDIINEPPAVGGVQDPVTGQHGRRGVAGVVLLGAVCHESAASKGGGVDAVGTAAWHISRHCWGHTTCVSHGVCDMIYTWPHGDSAAHPNMHTHKHISTHTGASCGMMYWLACPDRLPHGRPGYHILASLTWQPHAPHTLPAQAA